MIEARSVLVSSRYSVSYAWILMTKLFVSLRFDEFGQSVVEEVKSELRRYGVECVVAGDLTKAPPPEIVRSFILSSDGLLAIITKEQSDWVQNEIGIAYAAHLPVYGLVEEGVQVGGLLPQITTYVKFIRPFLKFDLKKQVAVVASELSKLGGIQAVVDDTEMLTGWSGTLQLAVRPRRIPLGEEIITVYIPPDFHVGFVDPHDEMAEFLKGVPRKTSTEIPESACRIVISQAGKNDAYPGFLRFEIVLIFPQVESYLSGGWAEFKLDYTAPTTAGKYRLFGTDQVSVGGSQSHDAASFDFDPILVKGEVSTSYLSGIIFTPPHKPLTLPGIVWAVMTMRLDPYTGQPRPDLPTVNATCYLSASDKGRYVIPGLAPGIYDVYASAVGFSTFMIKSNLRVQGQPESLDGQVQLTLVDADNTAFRQRTAENYLRKEQEDCARTNKRRVCIHPRSRHNGSRSFTTIGRCDVTFQDQT